MSDSEIPVIKSNATAAELIKLAQTKNKKRDVFQICFRRHPSIVFKVFKLMQLDVLELQQLLHQLHSWDKARSEKIP